MNASTLATRLLRAGSLPVGSLGITAGGAPSYTQLIDARAAGKILGVPHTWLLTQAREGRIPHHRLGHYVRFDPRDLAEWLAEKRIEAGQRLGRLR